MLRELDFIIFGATGFTGKYVVLEAVQILTGFKWGVAGRDKDKLEIVLKDVGTKTSSNLSHIPIIVANIDDFESLKAMSMRCTVLINCVGPFHLYGEPVVKTCIETKTHQIDISGDPSYILDVMLRYNDKARENGCFIVPACGVDSIPGDIGVIYLQNQFGGTLAEVEEFLEASGRPKKGASIHFGSYASIVHGCGNKKETDKLREKLFGNHDDTKTRGILHKSKVTGTWCTPFFGVDADLVRKSQFHFSQRDKTPLIQNQAYAATASIFESLGLIAFQYITRVSVGRRLLLSYPEFFSWGHVSRKDIDKAVVEHGNFTVHLYGKGWSNALTNFDGVKYDKEMYVKVKGKNNGYRSTAVATLSCAKMFLSDVKQLPNETGVLTPAIVFCNTRLVEELCSNGWTFEVVDVKKL